MKQTKNGLSVVSQVNYGVYVWKTPDGKMLVDQDFNVLNIPAQRGSIKAMAAITAAAKYYGIEGSPFFLEGQRRISEEEYQEQKWRLMNGYDPDPLDPGIYKDSLK